MQEVLLFATIIAPVVLGVTELFKKTFNVKVTYIPMVAVVVGLLVGLASQPFTELDLYLRLWAGGLSGLSATGLFELAKNREGTTKGDI